MLFSETSLAGVYLIEPELRRDERGFFARTFCQQEFAARGLNQHVARCGTSFNPQRGTLRGLHYQLPPRQEDKLVRCTRGAIYDVVVDLRADSVTWQQWIACELSAADHRMLYIPAGCAHGFLTLAEDTEVCYQLSEVYDPALARGVRWDDPALAIDWHGHEITLISDRDRGFPLLNGRPCETAGVSGGPGS